MVLSVDALCQVQLRVPHISLSHELLAVKCRGLIDSVHGSMVD